MKAGDKVRFIKSLYVTNDGRVTIGNVYDVLYIDEDEDLVINDDNGEDFFLTKLEVKLVKEATDSIVETIINKFKQRSEAGIKKYNTTLDRNDLSTLEWLSHLQEELMDATLYIERLKKEYESTN